MKKRLSMTFAAAALLVAMVPGVASAAIDEYLPVGSCPPERTDWVLIQIGSSFVDHNGDHWACTKSPGPQVAVIIDNSLPL